jgi:hypothetical protein
MTLIYMHFIKSIMPATAYKLKPIQLSRTIRELIKKKLKRGVLIFKENATKIEIFKKRFILEWQFLEHVGNNNRCNFHQKL